MIGKFFGYTAPMILVGLPVGEMESSIALLNNSTDSDTLQFLKYEFKKLEEFLDSLAFSYKNPRMNKTSADVRRTELFIKTNGEKGARKLSDEELEKAKAQLAIEPKILSSFMKTDNGVIEWSKEELRVLEFLMDSKYSIAKLKSCIKETSFEEITVFGYKLLLLKDFKSATLNNIIINQFKKLKHTNNKDMLDTTLTVWRRDLDVLESRVGSEDKNSLAKSETLNIMILQGLLANNKISHEDFKLGEILLENGLLADIPVSKFKQLCSLYSCGNQMGVNYYNSLFGLKLTKDEYDKLFDRLCEKGLVGLNLYFRDMFFDSLRSLTLIDNVELTIDEERNPDLIQFMYELRLFLDSFVEVGKDIERK